MSTADTDSGSYRGIWVYLEHEEGELREVSLEMLGKAGELASESGESVTAVLLGHEVRRSAEKALNHGADRVLMVDAPILGNYLSDSYTEVFSALVAERKPNIILIGATHNGRDLAGRTAVRIRTGLIADVIRLEIEPESGLLVGAVPGFGGGILALVECPKHRPQMVTVRPGIFQTIETEGKGEIEEVSVPRFSKDKIRGKILEKETGGGVDITQAEVIVAGGAAVDGDFSKVEELASLLGGMVGASRVAADNGWISRDHQIGQTGYTVKPKICICAGISGAVQFTCGIDESEVVIAINIDPDAPIFERADYIVVEDLHNLLPALISKVREKRG
ncbi:MAG: electron transfer flavoprotein subunit alpha/FixB family protein [Candidatus Neomarinimicrobiota bacterium]